MPHNIPLILTLAGGLTAALVLGFITHKLRMSPIVGYLLAGIVVGPYSPGFVADASIAEQLAELGVILLLFGVGLHFSLRELIAVRRIAIPGALVQIAAATFLGMLATWAAGWSTSSGLVYGLAISVASTVVLLRVLSDHNALHTRAGHVAVGWLLVEDLFTVLVLVLLPILAGASLDGETSNVLLSIGIALLKIAALIAFTLVVGQRVIPRLLGWVVRTRSRELFTLTVLVIAIGIAVGSATLFGASMALGAFLAGMVVGQSDFSVRAASEALPMRDAFAVLFFVSMGMLFDPTQLTSNIALTTATLAIILLGKPFAAMVVVLLLRGPITLAVTVAIALAQIGEFSFILAALGRQLDVLPESAMQSLVAASIISITLNPLLFRYVEPFSRWLSMRLKLGPSLEEQDEAEALDKRERTIVVGYGPVGRTLARLLVENELSPTIIELNHETLAEVRSHGLRAVHGDAAQRDVLEHAGVRNAGSLVFAASGSPQAVVSLAKELNPNLLILTRTTYVAEVPTVRAAGGDVVVAAEREVALAMTERLLEQLGATREQLDRARDRVRKELETESPSS